MSGDAPTKVAPQADEQVLVVCKADLVNPNHAPVFASSEPQLVSKAAVEAFPSKFEADEPETAAAPKPKKAASKKAAADPDGAVEKRG